MSVTVILRAPASRAAMHGDAADRAGAGDQHRLAEQSAAAVDARAAPPPAAPRTRARPARCRRATG